MLTRHLQPLVLQQLS